MRLFCNFFDCVLFKIKSLRNITVGHPGQMVSSIAISIPNPCSAPDNWHLATRRQCPRLFAWVCRLVVAFWPLPVPLPPAPRVHRHSSTSALKLEMFCVWLPAVPGHRLTTSLSIAALLGFRIRQHEQVGAARTSSTGTATSTLFHAVWAAVGHWGPR